MTRHKHAQTGLVTPQLPQLWLTAVLRVFAMLVLNVVSTLQMIRRRPAVNVTRQMPDALPRMKTDTLIKEPIAVPQDSQIALILRDRMHAVRTAELSRAIVSKDGKGVLTTMSHTAPSPSVSHATRAIHLPLLRMGRQTRISADARSEAELPPPPKAGEVACAP